MRISTSLRWLVVAVSAAMLLAVAAACGSETIEVPGETVVVEKVVTETVEVPGETVVVEKEVIRTVEVPGETVTKEVVKEVMVPGETVVVEKEVVKTVEVPGETVTVEVVKEVQVPGETVVVEKVVTQTVQVPGETVVVEKEVVKTVEVPGETVVVEKEVVKTVEIPGPERVVVKEVAGKKYVIDPTTGKAVTAPQYGGTITIPLKAEQNHSDIVAHISGYMGLSSLFGGVVLEPLAFIGDWGAPTPEFGGRNALFSTQLTTTPALAESWEQPDDKTYVFNIREGVHWHNKAPMNGRALTADDIVYNYHRIKGMGEFADAGPSQQGGTLKALKFESITATDRYTVVFKLTEPNPEALDAILTDWVALMYPPEVIKEHGDLTDWKNLVGTGPFEMTDWTRGSSVTYSKNPDYWGYDEKYPENRLPYPDELRTLVMPELATQLAALRSGRIDFLGVLGRSAIRNLDQVERLEKSNPEIGLWQYVFRSDHAFGMNTQKPPFDDIRVRKVMNMALDLETMNRAFFKGYADTVPQGLLSRDLGPELATPFEEWPEEVKKGHTYDPEGAKKLLAEAGYPNGFKVGLMHNERYDLRWSELAAAYWGKIGVDVEIDVPPLPTFGARRGARDFEMMSAEAGIRSAPSQVISNQRTFVTETPWNHSNVSDPDYDAMYEAGSAAATDEERNRIAKEMNMYAKERFWQVWGPVAPQYSAVQPWLVGYNGEVIHRGVDVFARLWIDQELKEAMGR